MRADRGLLIRAGWAALLGAALSVIVLPPGWLTIGLAGVAVVGLAQDRRLGWMPAGLLVTIALPFGRGADVDPLTVAGIPLRPHDLSIALALGAGLATLLRPGAAARLRGLRGGAPTFVVAGLVFLAVGIGALILGLAGDHAMRDVFRDARWWGLYLAAPLALLAGVSRNQLLRGALYGATAFAGLTIIASVAPVFEGGLKDGTLFYDLGTPRMQFGNSIFLMPAVAYAALRAVKRPSLPALGWVAGLVMSQVLSLTRTSILVTIGVVLLVLAGQFVVRARTRPRLDSFVGVLPTILVVAVGIGAAVGVAEYSTYSAPVPAGVDPAVPRQDPFGRITFTDEQSDVTVIVKSVATGGRFASYLNAARAILRSPVMGGGMGQLVEVAFAYNDVRAYTRGYQPGVDNAYLTVALKAGAIGVASLGAFLLLPALAAIRRRSRGLLAWFLPGWLGLLALTMTQSFAVSSYAPLGVALLASIPFLCVGRPGSLTSGR